jgi:hypothetical protein
MTVISYVKMNVKHGVKYSRGSDHLPPRTVHIPKLIPVPRPVHQPDQPDPNRPTFCKFIKCKNPRICTTVNDCCWGPIFRN